MLESPELEFIMEAHNGLSAKIVQEAGRLVILNMITHSCPLALATGNIPQLKNGQIGG